MSAFLCVPFASIPSTIVIPSAARNLLFGWQRRVPARAQFDVTQSTPTGSQSNRTHALAELQEYTDPPVPQLRPLATAPPTRHNPRSAIPDAPSSPDETPPRLPDESAPRHSQTNTHHVSQAPEASPTQSSPTPRRKTREPSLLPRAASPAAHDRSRRTNSA